MTNEIDQEIVNIAAKDSPTDGDANVKLAEAQAAHDGRFYADLISTIANLKMDEAAARAEWTNLLTHKLTMSEKLGRNVGVSVAALDYFKNISHDLKDVKIIDSCDFIATERMAVTDGLTDVYNHRAFYSEMRERVFDAENNGKTFCVLMLDIDNFKAYNDMNGHVAGDVVLREVAQLIKEHIREQDFVARYGGEEFAVIFPDTSKVDAVEISQRLVREVAAHKFPNQTKLPSGNLTISGGIANFPDDGKTVQKVVTSADKLLYASKSSGKNKLTEDFSTSRRHKRLPTLLKVTYLLEGERSKPVFATTLSRGGMSFTDNISYAVGTRLTFEMVFPPENTEQNLDVKIVWQKKAPGVEEYTYDVKHLDIRALAGTAFMTYLAAVESAK